MMLVIEAFKATHKQSLAKVAVISAELSTAMACPLKVAVRIRPPQPHDGRVGNVKSVQVIDGVTLEALDGSDSKQFVYDRVFGPVESSDTFSEPSRAMRKYEKLNKHIKTYQNISKDSSQDFYLLNISDLFMRCVSVAIAEVARRQPSRRSTVLVPQRWWMRSLRAPMPAFLPLAPPVLERPILCWAQRGVGGKRNRTRIGVESKLYQGIQRIKISDDVL